MKQVKRCFALEKSERRGIYTERKSLGKAHPEKRTWNATL
jgi:hypothetical protein